VKKTSFFAGRPSAAAWAASLALLGIAIGSPAAEVPAYRPASTCEECHPDIVRTWRTSQHATAFTDPEFQLSYDRIRRNHPRKALSCEFCHNPMRFLLEEDDPHASIFSREGVTCEFCHSVESAKPEGPFPRYAARPGIKFGPQGGEPGKVVHRTRFSRLHITSEFCAGCHEFANEHGVPVLSTYSEWRESFYRGEGVHCQFCHLPQLFDARVIEPRAKKGPLDHAMVGGHSRERLARAIPLRASLSTSGKEARLTVTLRNETVGHKTPSGIPLHRIRLASTIYDGAGNIIGRKDELFERVLGDGTGKAVDRAENVFAFAREVLRDNRLAPKETRTVRQVFPLGGAVPAAADVSLTYEMPAPGAAPDLRFIEVPISRTIVPAERGFLESGAGTAILAFLAIVLGAAATALFMRRR
jgi:hypothetical protein